MKVLFVETPHALLEARRRRGADHRDEMWNGVLHLVPLLGNAHQDLAVQFLLAVAPRAEARGLEAVYHLGLFRTDDDYRVPDQVYCRPSQLSERGAESAELIVEIHAEPEETYEKLDFYAARGVREVVVLHPLPRRVELFRNVAGRMLPVQGANGVYRTDVLGVELQAVDDKLRVTWADGQAEI